MTPTLPLEVFNTLKVNNPFQVCYINIKCRGGASTPQVVYYTRQQSEQLWHPRHVW
jgi:hypothetical protein